MKGAFGTSSFFKQEAAVFVQLQKWSAFHGIVRVIQREETATQTTEAKATETKLQVSNPNEATLCPVVDQRVCVWRGQQDRQVVSLIRMDSD